MLRSKVWGIHVTTEGKKIPIFAFSTVACRRGTPQTLSQHCLCAC